MEIAMNTHLANSLSMTEILAKIKQTPNPTQDQTLIAQVCTYLKEHKQDSTPFDAKRWIQMMSNNQEIPLLANNEFSLVKKYDVIKHPSLLFYLKNQNIPLNTAKQYLSELKVYHSTLKKHFFVLGFAHEKEGYVISNPILNDWIGEHSISFVRGQNQNIDTIHIFQNVWDYLSLLTHLKGKDFQTDSLILNAEECLPQVKAYLYQYGYRKAYTWLNNDKAGIKGTRQLGAVFRQEQNIIHIAMNAFYQPFVNLSDWYTHQVSTEQ